MELTDDQWGLIEPVVPNPPAREDGKGRPRREARSILEGILWVLRTGAPWKDLPGRYPPYQTCHRRFQEWVADGTLKRILTVLVQDLHERGGIDDLEGFIDGSYVPAKKGAQRSESAVPAMRRRSWRLQTATVFLSPLASSLVQDTTSRWSTKRSTKRS